MIWKDDLILHFLDKIDPKAYGYKSIDEMDFLHVPMLVGIKQQLRPFSHLQWKNKFTFDDDDPDCKDRILPVHVHDRPRDEHGNYFVYRPDMESLLEDSECHA